MEQKHVLFRFFPEKDYLEQFLKGSIYMNSMHYFWDEYNLADAARRKREIIAKNPCLNPDKIRVPIGSEAPRGQMDMMEGTIATSAAFTVMMWAVCNTESAMKSKALESMWQSLRTRLNLSVG